MTGGVTFIAVPFDVSLDGARKHIGTDALERRRVVDAHGEVMDARAETGGDVLRGGRVTEVGEKRPAVLVVTVVDAETGDFGQRERGAVLPHGRRHPGECG